MDKISVLYTKDPYRHFLHLFFIFLFLLPFYFLLYKLHIPMTNGFGCFDECMNYGAGYFMTYGNKLYSEIFFNHQPFMAYLSYWLQITTTPASLFDFLLKHRQLLLAFSFLWNVIIIKRFRLPGIFFVISYELSKHYIFGDRFLAESFIIYPMAYMAGLMIYKLEKKEIYSYEYYFTMLCTWFVVFMREPYVPAVLFQFLFLIGLPKTIHKKISLILFFIICFLTIFLFPFGEYFFSIVNVSYQSAVTYELENTHYAGLDTVKIIFYPVFVFFSSVWTAFRFLLIGFSAAFLITNLYLLTKLQGKKIVIILFILLTLVNIRLIEPGFVFYEAFHMIPWYGIFLLITFIYIQKVWNTNRIIASIAYVAIVTSFCIYLAHPENFIHHKQDPHRDFLVYYGETYKIGRVVNILSTDKQTYFLDGYDNLSLSYWESKRKSTYKYSWYIYFAPGHARYKDAREDMFLKSPPDFYYGRPPKENSPLFELPPGTLEKYQMLFSDKKPTNLYIKKSVISTITEEQWEKAKEFHIEKP